jgi:glutathione synthase/RimK-type ligase-like ATP-grasp enzyme
VILIVTHSRDLSADLVIRHLNIAGARFLRLDTDALGTPECHFGFSDGPTLTCAGQTFAQSSVNALWARRFSLPTIHASLDPRYAEFVRRETGVLMDAFLETLSCHQINPYMADRLAGNRLIQSQRAAAVGLAVPATSASQDREKVRAFLRSFPRSIIKALSFGQLTKDPQDEAHSVAFASAVNIDTDWSGLSVGPVLLQQQIDARFEWRVTTVGDRIFAARTASTGEVDWRREKNRAQFEEAPLPRLVADMLFRLCHDSAIVYGAHDLIETHEGTFVFLETNPAGQWGWLEASLGLPIGAAIAENLMINHG